MNITQKRPEAEIRVRVSWSCRLSGPAVARVLIVVAGILAAAAAAMPGGDGLIRDVLYSAAGFMAGSRPRP
jgi:hypothetical protein